MTEAQQEDLMKEINAAAAQPLDELLVRLLGIVTVLIKHFPVTK